MNATQNKSLFLEDSYLNGVLHLNVTSKFVIVCISSCLLLIGIPGNVLVIWTYKSVKRLRSLQNTFIINLAVCDTVIIGYLLPLNIAAVLMERCPLPGTMCSINGGVAHVCFTASLQSIMHIAILRYFKICQKHRFNDIFTTTNVTVILIGIWMVGIVFVIPLYLMEKKIMFDTTLHMCIFDRYKNALYTTIYKIICLAVPILVTASCYVVVYRHVAKSRRQISRHWNNSLARKRHFHEISITRSQFAVFIAYTILYIPFGITATVLDNRNEVPDSLHAASIYLCYTNSCINGIIYGLLNSNIRKAYKEVLSSLLPKNRVNIDQSANVENPVQSLPVDNTTNMFAITICNKTTNNFN